MSCHLYLLISKIHQDSSRVMLITKIWIRSRSEKLWFDNYLSNTLKKRCLLQISHCQQRLCLDFNSIFIVTSQRWTTRICLQIPASGIESFTSISTEQISWISHSKYDIFCSYADWKSVLLESLLSDFMQQTTSKRSLKWECYYTFRPYDPHYHDYNPLQLVYKVWQLLSWAS